MAGFRQEVDVAGKALSFKATYVDLSLPIAEGSFYFVSF